VHLTRFALATPKKTIFAVLTVSIYCGSLATLTAQAASNQYFDQGTSYYQRGDYLAASAAFSWAVGQTPNDANAHYYLANTLVKLGRITEAQAHYVAAIRLTKDPTIKSYSQVALNGILRTGQTPYPVPGLQMAPGGLNNRPMAQNSMGSPIAPQMAPGFKTASGLPWSSVGKDDSKQRANQMIDQQADRTSAGILLMGNGEAASVQREGQWRAATARTSATQTAQDMSRATYQHMPIYSAADIQAAQQRGDVASLEAMRDANERSVEAVNYAKAKVWETQAAAKNLQEQLNAPATAGGAKLKAEGTNLYVRNFDTPLVDPGPPMKAQPGKLEVVNPLAATSKSWENKQGTNSGGKSNATNANAKTSASVYGQVLPVNK
jgi:tetratricopeptide (TPR) repeat protein